MTKKRNIEIFSAGCPLCGDAIEMVKKIACQDCQVNVLDMKDDAVSERARSLGIRTVPAIVIDGKVADCCAARGPNEKTLRAAGIGKPLSET